MYLASVSCVVYDERINSLHSSVYITKDQHQAVLSITSNIGEEVEVALVLLGQCSSCDSFYSGHNIPGLTEAPPRSSLLDKLLQFVGGLVGSFVSQLHPVTSRM